MEQLEQLKGFFEAASDDPRITPAHISLFMALYHAWRNNDCKNPVAVFKNDVMRFSKISGRTTYQKCIQELHDYGYIEYQPSFNHFLGSLVSLCSYPQCIATIQTKLKPCSTT